MTIYLERFDEDPTPADPAPVHQWRSPVDPGCHRTNAHWQPSPGGGFNLVPAGPGAFGLAFLLGLKSGQAFEGRLCFDLPEGLECRVEVSGFATRFQRAYCTVSAGGRSVERGDEFLDCSVQPGPDGMLELRFGFRPAATREDWVTVSFTAPGSPGVDRPRFGGFSVHRRDHNPHYRGHQPARLRPDGTAFALQAAYFFRNYFHFEFELLRPGATIRGIELVCPVPVYGVRWFTAAPVEVDGAGPRPEPPGHPTTAPALIDHFGPEAAPHAHVIFGLVTQPLDLRHLTVAESDALRGFSLKVRFSDGREILQSLAPGDDPPESNEWWVRVLARLQELPAGHGRSFVEVGGRGEASALVRSLIGPGWDYRAIDIHPGPNVDLVGDAHHLSELLPANSVDVIYSSDVMEHFLAPWRFVLEANRVLKPGGLFLAMMPTTWSLHAEPWDFWRMSGHGWPAFLNSGTGFQLLESAVIDQSVIVPQLPAPGGRSRAQYAPAYEHTFAIARKVADTAATWTAYDRAWAAGNYER